MRISRESPRQTRFGYLHGAEVMYLGNIAWHERRRDPSWPRAADWAWIHEVVCQADYYERRGKVGSFDETFDVWDMNFCYHGVGHAFIYHTYFHPIEVTGHVCFVPPPLPLISNLTLAYEAQRMCMTAPTAYFRQQCSFGVFHSLSEWTFGEALVSPGMGAHWHQPDERGVPQESIFFPCDAMAPGASGSLESTMCFDNVFRWIGWGTWVFDEIRAHVLGGKGLASLCLANPWSPGMEEGHVQSCIRGMSEVFYPLFDKLTAARSEADLRRAPLRERCCHSEKGKCSTLWGATDFNSYDLNLFDPFHADYYNASTYTVPEAHCQLLWAGRVVPPVHVQHTLVAWCSSFVADEVRAGEVPLHTREWHRYLACTSGVHNALLSFAYSAVESPGALARVCAQLLDYPSWVPPTLRRLAYEACDFGFHISKEPRQTRYAKWDSLADAAWAAL